MNILRHLPNVITSMNLLMGCLALIFVQQGKFDLVFYSLIIASVLDFFDGLSARWLGVSGEYGKIYDSLVDLFSFGVIPGFVFMKLIAIAMTRDTDIAWLIVNDRCVEYLPYAGYIIILFSALRLAKFHVDKRQSVDFIGLATPANALLISSVAMILTRPEMLEVSRFLLKNDTVLVFLAIQCFLLVSEIPMYSLKFKGWSWKGNAKKYLFIAGALPLLYFFQEYSIPLLIFFYIIQNIVIYLFKLVYHEVPSRN